MTTTRFTEVSDKLNKMFMDADEYKKDALVEQMKSWLKSNNTDEEKREAIECFLAEINVF